MSNSSLSRLVFPSRDINLACLASWVLTGDPLTFGNILEIIVNMHSGLLGRAHSDRTTGRWLQFSVVKDAPGGPRVRLRSVSRLTSPFNLYTAVRGEIERVSVEC